VDCQSTPFFIYNNDERIKEWLRTRPEGKVDLAALDSYLAFADALLHSDKPSEESICVSDDVIIGSAIAGTIAFMFDGNTSRMKSAMMRMTLLSGKSDDIRVIFWNSYIKSLAALALNTKDATQVLESSVADIWNQVILPIENTLQSRRNSKDSASDLCSVRAESLYDYYPYLNSALWTLIVRRAILEKELNIPDTLGPVVDMLATRPMCQESDGNVNTLLRDVRAISEFINSEKSDPLKLSFNILRMKAQDYRDKAFGHLVAQDSTKGVSFAESADAYNKYLALTDKIMAMAPTQRGKGWLLHKRLYANTRYLNLLHPYLVPKAADNVNIGRNPSNKQKHGASAVAASSANSDPHYYRKNREHLPHMDHEVFSTLKAASHFAEPPYEGGGGKKDRTEMAPPMTGMWISLYPEIVAGYWGALKHYRALESYRLRLESELQPAANITYSRSSEDGAEIEKSRFGQATAAVEYLAFFERSIRSDRGAYIPDRAFYVASIAAQTYARHLKGVDRYSRNSAARKEFVRAGLLAIRLNPFDYSLIKEFSYALLDMNGETIFQKELVPAIGKVAAFYVPSPDWKIDSKYWTGYLGNIGQVVGHLPSLRACESILKDESDARVAAVATTRKVMDAKQKARAAPPRSCQEMQSLDKDTMRAAEVIQTQFKDGENEAAIKFMRDSYVKPQPSEM
jgi:hypothetical protein